MAIIVTGGTGKTGIRIAALLKQATYPSYLHRERVRPVRRGASSDIRVGRLVDLPNPFQDISEKVSAVYLVGPQAISDALVL